MEFYRSSLRGSGVLPEVSLSLLMSKQKIPLYLHVHPTGVVEAQARGWTISHLKYSRYIHTHTHYKCISQSRFSQYDKSEDHPVGTALCFVLLDIPVGLKLPEQEGSTSLINSS